MKKYQVFLSSTFVDLKEERQKVLDILLLADCIPSGMEAFVATDDEQFNVIKRVIDLCDYYILIIGKKYGSVNSKTNLSYTEMEYDYAISQDIPVLVFAIDDSVSLPPENVESDPIKCGKLAEFKGKAMQNRLANIWTDITDLCGKVAVSIMLAKQEIDRPGWHRGQFFNKEVLLQEISELKKENNELKNSLNQYQLKSLSKDPDNSALAFHGHKIKLHYTEVCLFFTSNTVVKEKDIEVTLDDLFKHIALRLSGSHTTDDFINAISSYVSGYYVNKQQALVVKNQYIQLGLFESTLDENGTEKIILTKKGISMRNELTQITE